MKTKRMKFKKLECGNLVLHVSGAVFVVDAVDLKDKDITICRMGGGFVYKLSKKQFLKDFKKRITEFVPTLNNEMVSIEESKAYPCKADKHDLWNGWVKPYFTKEVVLEILADFGFEVKEVSNESIAFQAANADEETITRTKFGFPLGSGSWIWSFSE